MLDVMAFWESWLSLHDIFTVSCCPSGAEWVSFQTRGPNRCPPKRWNPSKLVQIKDVRRICQAIEDACLPAPLFLSLDKERVQNYPNYPLGYADQSPVESCLFQIRAIPFPVDLRLVLAHPSSKQAFLPSLLAFALLFR